MPHGPDLWPAGIDVGFAQSFREEQATESQGPLSVSGRGWVQVATPPGFSAEACESDYAWTLAPFDGTPLEVFFGSLAAPARAADGAIGLESAGELGDMLMRQESNFDSVVSIWQLHEDPREPRPMPARPQVPSTVLPDFEWPSATAEVRFLHHDLEVVDGYAAFTSAAVKDLDGRGRILFPALCD